MNTKNDRFEGVFSLLLTPFHKDKSIDWVAYEKYLEWQLSMDPHGLFAVCGTSEMKWLTLDERLKLAEIAVKCSGDKPVVATANLEFGLDAQKNELKKMVETGIDGIVLVPPNGMGEDQEKLREHLAILADESTVPVFLYEWPEMNPKYISPEVYTDLVDNYGVFGIKDTTCTMEGIKKKIDGADSIVYQANTPFMYEAVKEGAKGMMAITTGAYNDIAINFWNAAKQGNDEEAMKWHQCLVVIDTFLIKAYPVTSKYMVQLRTGIMDTTCRWPIDMNEETKKSVEVLVKYIDDMFLTKC